MLSWFWEYLFNHMGSLSAWHTKTTNNFGVICQQQWDINNELDGRKSRWIRNRGVCVLQISWAFPIDWLIEWLVGSEWCVDETWSWRKMKRWECTNNRHWHMDYGFSCGKDMHPQSHWHTHRNSFARTLLPGDACCREPRGAPHRRRRCYLNRQRQRRRHPLESEC